MKISGVTGKKLSCTIAVTALAATLALTGCAGSASNDETSQKVDAMQSQLDEMEARIDKLDGQSGAVAEESKQNDEAAAAENLSKADFDKKLADLEKEIGEAVATAEQVAVPENQADRPAAYYDAVAPLDELDNKLDVFEDSLEASHRGGTVTQEEFWELEKAKNQLENQLEKAEDSLELRMGVDD